MVPDQQIAAKGSQEETKSKYVVQFGLAPFEGELITDVQKTPYFGETTSQVKNQYDGQDSFLRKIVTYCGSQFVGYYTADDTS